MPKRRPEIKMRQLFAIALLSAGFTGCATSEQRTDAVGVPAKQMTPGLVQKEIRNGMSQTQVAEALGSPNIVTRDSDGKETWVYDKIATEVSSSRSNAYGTILIIGAGKERSSTTVNQRTMTVLIKFDKDSKVESYTFHASSF
jgi:outer membrane protein assembly factor BamE (lipoprotein component of BamABCDE complex)